MNYIFSIIIIFVLAGLLSFGCGDGIVWKDDRYVVWAQDPNELVLSRSFEDDKGRKGGVDLIDSKIIAVGSDKLYVVAKRKDPVSKIIFYYYIEKNKDDGKYISFKKMTHGPFDKAEFLKLKKELGLPAFTKAFAE